MSILSFAKLSILPKKMNQSLVLDTLQFFENSSNSQPTVQSQNHHHGFTLVEVMIVIVILSIFAGMMTLSVGGSESRKNKAFYEHLQSNINYVRLLAVEQMQPYGLAIKLAQNNSDSQIMVVKLQQNTSQNTSNQNSSNQAANSNSQSPPSWQLDKQVEPLNIPENVDVSIAPLNSTQPMAVNQPNWLVGEQAPPVVWFGTGEATPVQITVKAKNGDGDVYLVDNPIIVNATGSIEEPSAQDSPTMSSTNGTKP